MRQKVLDEKYEQLALKYLSNDWSVNDTAKILSVSYGIIYRLQKERRKHRSLYQFLYDNKSTAKFLRNLKSSSVNEYINIHDLIQNEKPEDYIRKAFTWGYTPEGAEYWWKLNKKWLKNIR